MYDNSYYYSYDLSDYGDYGSSSSGLFAGLAAFGTIFWVISMAIAVLLIISMWKIFDKCGEKGWKSIIPIYNIWVFFKICDLPGWLCLIPFVNTVCLFISYYRIAIKLDKGSGLGVLNIFFPVICMPILAFSKTNDSNNYQNASNANNSQYNMNNTQANMNNGQYNMNNTQVNMNSNQSNVNSIAAEQQRLEQESMNYEAVKTCPNCNNTCSVHAKFCGNCGYDFQNK